MLCYFDILYTYSITQYNLYYCITVLALPVPLLYYNVCKTMNMMDDITLSFSVRKL